MPDDATSVGHTGRRICDSIVNKERFVVRATRYRRSLLAVPTGAVAIVFWLLAMIVICVAAAVIFTVRLAAKFTVMVCRNFFRYFPG